MDESSNPTERRMIVHGPHETQAPHIESLLAALGDEEVEIEQIVDLLKQSVKLVTFVTAEARRVARRSRVECEVRSLKHAVSLLGLARLKLLIEPPTDTEPAELKISA